MNFTKKNLLISLFFFIVALVFQLIKSGSIEWIETSNITFIFAGIFLMIGLAGLVIASESFDFFHYSMRKVINKKGKNIKNEESLDPHALSASIGKNYRNILTIGFILIIISILCLWNYIF